MAHEITLIEAARKIRDSVRAYAKGKGWVPSQYRILMDFQATWGTISMVLFSQEFQRINSDQIQNEMDYYNEIMDRLSQDLETHPGIYESISLLLRPLDEYYLWGYRGSVEGTVEIEDGFLNPDLGPEELRGPIGSQL